MDTPRAQVQELIEKAKTGFGRDLLTPGYSQVISDAEHLANILKLCDLLPGRSYLDIGTGSGYVAFELARQNPTIFVTGIDIVEQVIEADLRKAQEMNGRQLKFMTFAGTKLPFEAGSFYGAVSRYAFHHFPLPELSVHEIHRVLEPEGFCVISDPMTAPGDDVDFVNQFGTLKDDGHVRYYPRPALVELFEKAGFQVEKSFASSITFPREMDTRYEHLLKRTEARILDQYRLSMEGKRIWITLPVMNLYFRKSRPRGSKRPGGGSAR